MSTPNYAQEDAAAEEREFNKSIEEKIEDIMTQMSLKAHVLTGDTLLDKFVLFSIDNYRNVEEMMEKLEPPSYEEKMEKMKVLAGNSQFVNGRYIITIFLGGRIPYRLPLFSYVPWDAESEYFKIFEQVFAEKK
jgi:hypothetical protein